MRRPLKLVQSILQPEAITVLHDSAVLVSYEIFLPFWNMYHSAMAT